MKHLTFALVALFFSALACGAPQTLYVDGGEIKTAAGEPFVMRGFNEMFVWSDDPRGERLIPEIARTGANALRLVWSYQYPDLRDLLALIDRTLAHKMVAIVECHDATGKWGDQLQRCVDFWKNPLLVEAIESNRRWTILNIANEAGAQGISDEAFIATYQQAVRQLRDRVIRFLL